MRSLTAYTLLYISPATQGQDAEKSVLLGGQTLILRKVQSHATELLRNGIPPYIVAQRLGDEVQTILNTYAHAKPEDDQVSADSFAEIIRNA